MWKRILIYLLLGGLFLVTLIGYEKYTEMSNEINSLRQDNDYLQSMNVINKTNVKKLELANQSLEADVEQLEEEYMAQKNKASALQADIMNSYIFYDNDMNKIPGNYYSGVDYNKTTKDLKYYLNNTFVMPTGYELNVFDCSEQAAYMERELENAGFMTEILVGDSPTGGDLKHAWIMVYTIDNYRTAIEPTIIFGTADSSVSRLWTRLNNDAIGIVYSNQNANYYDAYEERIENIYYAVTRLGIDEVDWWYGMWGLEDHNYYRTEFVTDRRSN